MNDYPNEPTAEEYQRMTNDDAAALAQQFEASEEWKATRALTVAPEQAPVRTTAVDVTAAIVEYTKIKDAIDRALPDCIMTIQGKQFRKKQFWRAVATAFNLTLEIREEKLVAAHVCLHRSDEPEGGAWGYIVTYRAHAPNGRYADGDGACFASEKNEAQATVHNVRGHAHTRAMNRAISNLVGFGEVSAEEVQHEPVERGAARKAQVAPSAKKSGVTDSAPRSNTISDPQRKRLWAIWSKRYEEMCPYGNAEHKKAAIEAILGAYGYSSSKDIQIALYDTIVQRVETWERAYDALDEPDWNRPEKGAP